MTTQEFSNAFDTLLNSYSTQAEFGDQASKVDITLDEYEKSLFLTQAQENVVLGLYSGRSAIGDSFESTEELKRNLSNLIATAELTPEATPSVAVLSSNSKTFSLPNDLWFITYEAITISSVDTCLNNKVIRVVPITQDEYLKVRDNPFRGATRRQGLRLDLANKKVEIITPFAITKYTVRYLKELTPIILETLPEGLTIKGISIKTECALVPSIHNAILNEAVRLALQSKLIAQKQETNQ